MALHFVLMRIDVESVRALIADHFAVDVCAVRDDAQFTADLGADSLDLVELSLRIEEALDISIDDEETDRCETVADALALIQSKTLLAEIA